MPNEPTPPDPEQIVPPPPTPRWMLFGLAALVVVVLVAFVFLLRWMNQPASIGDVSAFPTLGDANAPLTIFEYASFGCERCAKARVMVKEVLARYEGKVKLAFVNYPQASQPVSIRAAKAGLCASDQHKFWEFADLMFDRQSSWMPDPKPESLWMVYASQVGIDTNRMLECMSSDRAEQTIQQQMMAAAAQVVQQTPTFLIGRSRVVDPRSADAIVRAIDKELAALDARAAK
jgi:protein-disulfide isomerase